jgi:hypothetical protein
VTEWQPPAAPPVPIFDGAPKDWKELQALVALLFSGMGCTAEVEKSVPAARGAVELDVFATDSASGHKITYVCECKLWSKPVSQHVVHSFRTVVADIGADIGIIISANGFQRGAVAAAELTNIRLLTWEGFQQTFENRWTEAKIGDVDAHAARVLACGKKMPALPNTALKRPEYLKDLIQSQDEFQVIGDWYVRRDSLRSWVPGKWETSPFGSLPSRHDFFEATLQSMIGLADRAEAILQKWTEHSFTDKELLGGPMALSFEEAAAALEMPVEVFGGVVQDIYVDGNSFFHEQTMQYGVDDLIRIVRRMPQWLRE